MKLSDKEKIILAIFLAVVIIVVGVFLIIIPEYDKIDPNKASLESAKTQRDQINQTLLREITIDDEIQTALDKANTFSGNFYDDLSTYQADMILRDILKATGLETGKMSISDFTTSDLTLNEYVDAVVTYPLKDYSGFVAPSVIDLSAYGITYDENGNITVPEGFTLDDTKDLLKDYMRALLQTQIQTIGSITVNFDVKGTRKQYIDFLDYVAKLDKATHIDSCSIMYTETFDDKGNNAGVPGGEGEEAAPAPTPTGAVNGTKMTEFGSENLVKLTDDSHIAANITITFYSVIPPQFGSETEAAETEPAA